MPNVVIVGAGAIGSRTAEKLKDWDLTIIDRDVVMQENLDNQLYTKADLGKPKALVLAEKFGAKGLAIELDNTNVDYLNSDIVLDCVDNLASRHVINKYCKDNSIPWIHAAAIQNQFEVMPVISGKFSSIFGDKIDGKSCAEVGLEPEAADLAAEQQAEVARQFNEGLHVEEELIRGDSTGWVESFSTKELPEAEPPIPEPTALVW